MKRMGQNQRGRVGFVSSSSPVAATRERSGCLRLHLQVCLAYNFVKVVGRSYTVYIVAAIQCTAKRVSNITTPLMSIRSVTITIYSLFNANNLFDPPCYENS